jgi:hypothetical protein
MVTAHVVDDMSGVSQVDIVFSSATASLVGALSLASGTQQDGVWSGNVEVPQYAEPVWQIQYIQVSDFAGHSRLYGVDELAAMGQPTQLSVTTTGPTPTPSPTPTSTPTPTPTAKPQPEVGHHHLTASMLMTFASGVAVNFKGTGSVDVTSHGAVAGSLTLSDSTLTYQLYGFIPLTVTYQVSVGPVTGHVDVSDLWSLAFPITVQIPSLETGGISLLEPGHNEATAPSTVQLSEKAVLAHGVFVERGTFTLAAFGGNDPVAAFLTHQLSGTTNVALTLTK